MPRLIFKCPYIKGGTSSATAHLENYVKYMATRNGVERIDPGRSEWPATSKQKKMVEQILRDFPLSRGMFEYEDYAAEPTRTNASEFITRALEDNYNQIAKKDNYLKYIATRPRAQRVGSHGLFTGEEDQLVRKRSRPTPVMCGCPSSLCGGKTLPVSAMIRRKNGKHCSPSMPWKWRRR